MLQNGISSSNNYRRLSMEEPGFLIPRKRMSFLMQEKFWLNRLTRVEQLLLSGRDVIIQAALQNTTIWPKLPVRKWESTPFILTYYTSTLQNPINRDLLTIMQLPVHHRKQKTGQMLQGH